MRLLLLLVGLAAAAEVGPGAYSPQPSHPRERHAQRHRADAGPRRRRRAQVIRDKKEAEQVAKKLFKDRPGPPKKVKDARKAVKKEESIKLTRGGGAPPIPKPPSGEPPSEEEAAGAVGGGS